MKKNDKVYVCDFESNQVLSGFVLYVKDEEVNVYFAIGSIGYCQIFLKENCFEIEEDAIKKMNDFKSMKSLLCSKIENFNYLDLKNSIKNLCWFESVLSLSINGDWISKIVIKKIHDGFEIFVSDNRVAPNYYMFHYFIKEDFSNMTFVITDLKEEINNLSDSNIKQTKNFFKEVPEE